MFNSWKFVLKTIIAEQLLSHASLLKFVKLHELRTDFVKKSVNL